VGDAPVWAQILGFFGGPALVAYFANMALKDRDKRLGDIEKWREDHEKEHLSGKELIRMHEENRSWLSGLAEQQEKNFLHLNSRIDSMIERPHKGREND